MTLTQACGVLQQKGHTEMTVHEDHLCTIEDAHYLDDCPLAPNFAFTEEDVAALRTGADVDYLLADRLRAEQGELAKT